MNGTVRVRFVGVLLVGLLALGTCSNKASTSQDQSAGQASVTDAGGDPEATSTTAAKKVAKNAPECKAYQYFGTAQLGWSEQPPAAKTVKYDALVVQADGLKKAAPNIAADVDIVLLSNKRVLLDGQKLTPDEQKAHDAAATRLKSWYKQACYE